MNLKNNQFEIIITESVILFVFLILLIYGLFCGENVLMFREVVCPDIIETYVKPNIVKFMFSTTLNLRILNLFNIFVQ